MKECKKWRGKGKLSYLQAAVGTGGMKDLAGQLAPGSRIAGSASVPSSPSDGKRTACKQVAGAAAVSIRIERVRLSRKEMVAAACYAPERCGWPNGGWIDPMRHLFARLADSHVDLRFGAAYDFMAQGQSCAAAFPLANPRTGRA